MLRPLGDEVNIEVICVGKLKERFWADACAEYLKRLQAYAKVRVVEVADADPARAGGEEQARRQEGARILEALAAPCHVIALAIDGKQRTSVGLSEHLDELALRGTSDIAFIIGGSTGLAPEVLQRAHEKLSFGAITLPHNLARVVLLEQIYRAFKISRNEPYHK